MKVFPVYQPYQKRCRLVFIGISEAVWDKQAINERLEHVFQEGQNEFNPVPGVCSVSVGDIVFMDERSYICEPSSWREITAPDLYRYCNMNEDKQWEYARNFNRSKQDAK